MRAPQDVSGRFGTGDVEDVVCGDLVPGDWVPSTLFPKHAYVWDGETFVVRSRDLLPRDGDSAPDG